MASREAPTRLRQGGQPEVDDRRLERAAAAALGRGPATAAVTPAEIRPPISAPAPACRGSPRAAAGAVAVSFVLGPVALAEAGGWPGHRDFVQELGSALGIVALGLLGLLLVLPARLRVFERLGADVAVRLHRRVASGFLAILAAHIVVVIGADPTRVGLFRFVGQPWRAQAAVASTAAILLLVATARGRRRLRLPYARWRIIHAGLAVAAILLAVVHTIGWNRYLMAGVPFLAAFLVTAVTVLPIASLRLRREGRRRRGGYRVDSVVGERGGATTLHLRADGHWGHGFRPGQFAWIKLEGGRSRADEHPFSYTSSAEHPDRPSFTVRGSAGFSAAVGQLQPGTRMLVDGPHGGFCSSPASAGLVLIANGIGITPMMSILRTAAERGDRRSFVLIYGNRDLASISFGDELEQLKGRLRLDVVHVLSRPGPEWTGIRGRITSAVLERALPHRLRGWEFFLCGAGPAVNSSLRALAEIGVPPERVHAERFVEV